MTPEERRVFLVASKLVRASGRTPPPVREILSPGDRVTFARDLADGMIRAGDTGVVLNPRFSEALGVLVDRDLYFETRHSQFRLGNIWTWAWDDTNMLDDLGIDWWTRDIERMDDP